MDVISAYQQVGTYRGAASMCGVNHKTVKRIIERQESGGSKTPDRKPRDHNYESVAALAADRVAVTRGRISAKRLPAAGAAGQYCLVKLRREYGYAEAQDTALWCRCGVSRGRRGRVRA